MPAVRVEILGDASSLKRAYKSAAESSRTFNRSTTTMTGSVGKLDKSLTKGRHSMIGFGKSALYAGGALIGASSVYEGLKKSITAAEDFNVAQRQLQAQLKANGESFKSVAPWIAKTRTAQEHLGFTVTETEQAFTKLDRASRKASVAMRYMTVTTDLARARNIDLALSAQLIGKIIQGNTTALNRFGIILPKHITWTKALAIVQQRLAKQAEASVTPFNRFGAALNDLEIVIGNRILPVVTKYLDKVTEWMSKSRNQKRVADDVNHALKLLGDALAVVKGVLDKSAAAFRGFSDAVGGAKHAIELLGTAFLVFKARSALVSAGLVGVGRNAETSAAKVGGLRSALLRLGAIGAVAVGIDLIVNRKGVDNAVSGFLDRNGLPGGTNQLSSAQVIAEAGKLRNTFGPKVANKLIASALRDAFSPFSDALAGIGKAAGANRPAAASVTSAVNVPGHLQGTQNAGLSARQQFQLALAASPDSIRLLKQQADKDRAAIAFAGKLRAESRISNQKYVAEVTAYQSDLQSTLATIAGITQAAADKIKAAAAKAAAARRKALREDIPGRVSGTVYNVSPELHRAFMRLPGRVSGEAPYGGFQVPILLQLQAAKAASTKSLADDKSAARAIKNAAERAISSGKLAIQGQIDAWNAITDANNQLTGTQKGDVTKFRHVSTSKLLAGLGLSPGEMRAARERLAAGHRDKNGNWVVPQPSGQFTHAGGGYVIGELHLHGVQNMQQLEDTLEKRARSRPQVRRGAR